ncbi:MAG: hypothetical protein LKJ88_07485 [Bacilli bacterium]|jgi:ABC-type glycerol-3-phosphate transport system substrate-binding protein|nr:hypothetical protein [Bacilli bacterium]
MFSKNKMAKVVLVSLFSLGALSGCGASSGSENSSTAGETSETFSYYQAVGESTNEYSNYSDNPSIRYLTKYMKWGKNKDVNINFDFSAPATGASSDVINTMIASGDYTDIMDTTGCSTSVADLYADGVALDLTDMVKEYMPNYLAWLDKHEEYKKVCFTKVNGEEKILKICDMNDSADPWGGFNYRRDWLVKYGANPTTKAAFTGGWKDGVWTDDVVFPSGEKDPIYVSDWEWMFGIFKTALTDQGISDGYAFQIPYNGSWGTGDVIDSFGAGPSFYLDQDKKTMKFGATSEASREYLKLVNKWYKAGYIDTKFAEHSTDMFYSVDTTKVSNGKVGMWYGLLHQCDNGMDLSSGKENSSVNGYTNGICVFSARQPINNSFGATSMQNITPFFFYELGLINVNIIITSKAQGKNIPALLTLLDYLYSDEGAFLSTIGLSKEQYEISQDPVYKKLGLTEGAWYYCDEQGIPWVEGTSTGKKMWREQQLLLDDEGLRGRMFGNRFMGRRLGNGNKFVHKSATYLHSLSEVSMFDSNFAMFYAAEQSLAGDDAFSFGKINTSINDFMSKNCPKFVNGVMDINNDATWNSYCQALNKYKPDTGVSILQNCYDNM